jgi:hypothetical protein
MDVSVFFFSRVRFWSWILIPLVLRLVMTAVFAFVAREPAEELERLKAYEVGVEKMEKAKAEVVAALKPFEENVVMPFQGYFLTDISRHSKSAMVQTRPTSRSELIKGTKLIENRFEVSGSASSLHEMSQFVDLMMQVPRAAITSLNLRSVAGRGGEQDSGEVTSVDFNIRFVRVELSEGQVR